MKPADNEVSMTWLIYHPIEASTKSVSRFDETIMGLVASKPIQIACPYLGRVPLQRILDRCTEWQLLTDVEELLRSQTKLDRDWFGRFLVGNASCVRHCKRLHAKVILNGQQALVGSANFTLSGLERRTEMAVLLSDEGIVKELGTWFSEMWKRCPQLERDAVLAFAGSLPDWLPINDDGSTFSLPTGPQVNTILQPVTTMRGGRWTEDAYLALVAEKWPDLLPIQTEVIESLKEIGAIRFTGNGPKEATYHAVLPESHTDVLWVYADGRIYARWGKLGEPAATRYKGLWNNLIDTSRPDGSLKNDGCNLKGGIMNIDVDQIIQNIVVTQEAVAPKAGRITIEKVEGKAQYQEPSAPSPKSAASPKQ